MNNKEFENVLKQPPNVRYEYFIKKVVDFEEVWGLYDDGQGNMLIPFFPRQEFAQHCAVGDCSNFKPQRIDLYDFIEEWLKGMEEDGVKPSIFPTNDDTAVAEIDVLLRDLQTELENY